MLSIRINSNNTAQIFTHCKWWKTWHACIYLYTIYIYIYIFCIFNRIWKSTVGMYLLRGVGHRLRHRCYANALMLCFLSWWRVPRAHARCAHGKGFEWFVLLNVMCLHFALPLFLVWEMHFKLGLWRPSLRLRMLHPKIARYVFPLGSAISFPGRHT